MPFPRRDYYAESLASAVEERYGGPGDNELAECAQCGERCLIDDMVCQNPDIDTDTLFCSNRCCEEHFLDSMDFDEL